MHHEPSAPPRRHCSCCSCSSRCSARPRSSRCSRPTSSRQTARNIRTLDDSYSAERGADPGRRRQPVAKSVPSSDVVQVPARSTPTARCTRPSPDTSPSTRRTPGIEGALNDYLSGNVERAVPRPVERDPHRARTRRAPRSRRRSTPRSSRPPGMRSAISRAPSSRSTRRPAPSWPWCRSPTYDPNTLAVHNSEAGHRRLQRSCSPPPGSPLTNRAIAGEPQPPGSTFKLVVARGRPRQRQGTPDSAFPNPAALQLPAHEHLHHTTRRTADLRAGRDRVDRDGAMRLSCNIPFAAARRMRSARTRSRQQAEPVRVRQAASRIPMQVRRTRASTRRPRMTPSSDAARRSGRATTASPRCRWRMDLGRDRQRRSPDDPTLIEKHHPPPTCPS